MVLIVFYARIQDQSANHRHHRSRIDALDAGSGDESVQGVRRLAAWLATEPRLTAVALQTVGSKGYDGFLLARVIGE